MITVNKANPTPGEITSSLTGFSGDGGGLNLANGGTIQIANNAATEFSTTDFTIEFVLNQTADNVSDNYIYYSHNGGNSRMYMFNDISANVVEVVIRNSSGTNSAFTVNYDMSQDYGTPTHYVFAFDRSGDLTLYKNGNSVASVDISAASSINIGAGNANVSQIGSGTNNGVLGTFYRFRAFNTLADAKLLFERADVPQTLTANLLYDLDLAFANPTQSLTVQDRKGNTDGTCSASGVTQVQPVVQLNSTSARIGTSAATPADGELMVSGNVSISDDQYYQWGGTNARIVGSHSGDYVKILTGNSAKLTIDSSGAVKIAQGGELIIDKAEAGNGTIRFYKGGAASSYIQYDASENLVHYMPSSTGEQQFYTGGSKRLSIDSTGKTTANALKVLDPTHGRYFDFVLDSSASYLDVSHALNLRVNGASSLATALTINSTGLATFSGDLECGTVSATGASVGWKSLATTSSSGPNTQTSADNTGTRGHYLFYNPNGEVGSIKTNGSATSFNTSSDYRLKENLTPLTGALDRLDALPVYRFNFKADPDTTVDGFVAHEVSAHVPEAVTGEKDAMKTVVVQEAVAAQPATYYEEGDELPEGKSVGDEKTPAIEAVAEVTEEQPDYQGIDQSKLVPLLVAAVKELKAKVETLENA